MSAANAYWAGKKQPLEMVEKRSAAMRGKKRKPYKPWNPDARARHTAAMAAKKKEPSIGCINCKQMIRPTGFSRHVEKCLAFQCFIINCTGSIRFGALGYCGDHYALHKAVKSKYGITAEEYYEIYESQHGRCKICGEPGEPIARAGRSRKAVLHLDHNHDTGKIRGMLCHNCNIGIGHLGDDIARLTKAVQYLREEL